jgi:hypothetical protein
LVSGGIVEELEIQPEEIKNGSKVVSWRRCFEELNSAATSRLVLFAHGDQSTTRVADRTGERMARLLVDRFGLRKVTRISLLACYGGGDQAERFPGAPYHIPSVKCFAQEFHYALGREKNVRTEVTARTGVANSEMGTGKRQVWVPNELGAQPESGKGEYKHKAPGTKVLWYWENGQQRVRQVY